jgi:hypothetical protein
MIGVVMAAILILGDPVQATARGLIYNNVKAE